MMRLSQRFRRFTAMALALFFTALLLGLLKLSESEIQTQQETLLVRKIDVAAPPPPPPSPPVEQADDSSIALDLNLSGNSPAMAVSFKQSKTMTQATLAKPPSDSLTQPNWDINWTQDWQAFGLGELDKVPQLLTPIRVDFPDALKHRGINKSSAKLHVMIDEQGQVHLKGISYIDNPELKPGIKQAVRQARFTIPRKSGQAVKAEFIWPMEIEPS